MTQVAISPQASVTLDGSGNGQCYIGPPSGAMWQLRLATISTTGTVSQPHGFLYRGSTSGPLEQIDSTFLGNSASSGKVAGALFYPGQVLWAKWTGGDAGAVATLQAYGTQGRRGDIPFDPGPVGEGFALSLATSLLVANSIINSSGMFFYSSGPAPVFGKLIASLGVTTAGTDAAGNAYLAGDTNYSLTGLGGVLFAVSLNAGVLTVYTAASAAGPWTQDMTLLPTLLPSFGNVQAWQTLAPSLIYGSISNPTAESLYPPSGDTSGTTDTHYIGELIRATRNVRLTVGTYYVNTGSITIDQKNTGPVSLVGPGVEECIINVLGTGDGIRWFDSKTGGNAYLPGGGKFTGVTLDGTGLTGTGSSLLHIGDLYNFELDISVQNVPTAVGKGVWLDNQYLFMEQLRGRIQVHQCGHPAVQFDNSANISGAATGSFDRARFEIMLDQKGQGDCVVFANGAFMTDDTGSLTIAGNTDYGAAQYWVLTLTGSNAGGESRLTQCVLNIGVECNGTVGTQPGTIKFGTTGLSGNQIFRCTGLIDFSANNPFAGSNNDHSFLFYGPVYGDTKLQPSVWAGPPFKFGGSGLGGNLQNSDTITTKFLGVVEVAAGLGAVTGIILDGFNPDDWRRISVMNNSANSITFAASGTSHVASGTACVIAANVCQDFIWNPDLTLWFAVQ